MGQSQSAPIISCCNGAATVRTRLDRHTFTAGETVTGVLFLHIHQEVVINYVVVKVKCEEQGSSKAVADATVAGQSSPDTDWGLVTLERMSILVREQKLSPGTYAYPISLQLPSDAPPSFFVKREASEQHVSLLYWLEAEATMGMPSTHPTISDETLLTLLPAGQPRPHPRPADHFPPLDQQPNPLHHPQQQHRQQQHQQEEEEEAVRALLQAPQQPPNSLKRQLPLSSTGIVPVPGTCFGSRGAVIVEAQGATTVLKAGQEFKVTLQVKNHSAMAIARLVLELHQCGGLVGGYTLMKMLGKRGKLDPRKFEVSRCMASAESLPGLAPGECRQNMYAVQASVKVGRWLQGCVSGKAVRMYYALVVKAVGVKGQVIELLRVPLQAEHSASTTRGSNSSKPSKIAA